jgi:1,4-dihydroxy-2-naphthoate octaprenyltransferase
MNVKPFKRTMLFSLPTLKYRSGWRLQRSTLQLLRFPFSVFLMPVYWFALSTLQQVDTTRAVLVFLVLHLLVYPSSNGYNSYMDRDTTPIGGIAHPLQPTKQLLYITWLMDGLALLLSLGVSLVFAAGIACYIVFSHLYSYRGIRLKRYPITGYLTVIVNQGMLVFCLVYDGCGYTAQPMAWQLPVAAALLIGGFYPITQVYQHAADAKDGVRTISMLLGTRGTFVFCAVLYMLAFTLLFSYYLQLQQLNRFVLLQLFFVPVIVYFIRWAIQVWRDSSLADFRHTMRMNLLASACTNLAFICLFILQQLH